MSYSQKVAQKLLLDLVSTSPEIVSAVLIDLHRGTVVAGRVYGTISLTDSAVIAQLIQLCVSHQTLDLLIANGSITIQMMVRREAVPKDGTSVNPGLSDYLVWRWDAERRWLLVAHTNPHARLGLVLLDMNKALDECAKQLIDEE